jgi:hypothetical protein
MIPMPFKFPLSSDYIWTKHAQAKMAYYRISPARVKRVIKSCLRVEEGIAPDTVAFMQPVSYKTKNGVRSWSQEYWVMAVTQGVNKQPTTINLQQKNKAEKIGGKLKASEAKSSSERSSTTGVAGSKLKIISTWRYPGKTKPGQSLPMEIKDEINEALSEI